MKLRFVGTGDSAQVPRFGCDCPACALARVLTSHRRGTCCAEVRVDGHRYLLDAGRIDLADSCEAERPTAILLPTTIRTMCRGCLICAGAAGSGSRFTDPRTPRAVRISTATR